VPIVKWASSTSSGQQSHRTNLYLFGVVIASGGKEMARGWVQPN
jgi:hypothetical protein